MRPGGQIFFITVEHPLNAVLHEKRALRGVFGLWASTLSNAPGAFTGGEFE